MIESKQCLVCAITFDDPVIKYCRSCGRPLDMGIKRQAISFSSRWFPVWFLFAMFVGTNMGGEGDLGLYLMDCILIAWVVLIVKRNKISVTALIGRTSVGFNWLWVPFIAIVMFVFGIGATLLSWYPIMLVNAQFASDVLSEPVTDSATSFFVLAVVIAPVLEEIIFRGLLFTRLADKWGINRAIIVSSVVFGMLHLDPIGKSIFGVMACVIYMRTRTLWIPIALHSFHNFIAWYLMVGAPVEQDTSSDLQGLLMSGIMAIALSLPVIYYLLYKWWPRRQSLLPYQTN